MKVTLERMNQAVHFRATSAEGHTVDIDGGETSDGEDKGVRAIDMSLDKYCSVVKMLDHQVDISYAFSINGIEVKG